MAENKATRPTLILWFLRRGARQISLAGGNQCPLSVRQGLQMYFTPQVTFHSFHDGGTSGEVLHTVLAQAKNLDRRLRPNYVLVLLLSSHCSVDCVQVPPFHQKIKSCCRTVSCRRQYSSVTVSRGMTAEGQELTRCISSATLGSVAAC